jgi:hypothetical protein
MHGTEDVTANYVITAVAGKLTVNQKSVTVTAQDKEFTYNGEAQTWNQYDVDGLVGSDQISAVVEGSITFPSQNSVANTIKSYNFTTGKPGNYSVTTANGQLTMTNASVAITITAASQSWTYDGNAHTAPTVTLTSGALFTGDELVAEATGSVTNVADTQADNNPVASGYKVMHGDEDVTASYVITAVAGTLTITEAPASIAFAISSIDKICGDPAFSVGLTVKGDGDISYQSDNKKVATVDKNGQVTVLRAGTTTITATLSYGKNYQGASTSFKLNVSEKQIKKSAGLLITWDVDGYHYTINENEATAAVISNEYSPVASLTYTRTLWIKGKTAVDVDGEQHYLFTLCTPFEPRFSGKFYSLTSVTGSVLRFDQIQGQPQAFTPYLVATDKDVAVTPQIIDGNIDQPIDQPDLSRKTRASDETKEVSVNVLYPSFSHTINDSPDIDGFKLRGTLFGLTNEDAAAEGAYILQNNGTWGAVKAGNENVYIPPFRAYVTAVGGNLSRSLNSNIGIGTNIERIVTVDHDGTERWYDLQGRRIEKPATKGIYIHNGRKEAVK